MGAAAHRCGRLERGRVGMSSLFHCRAPADAQLLREASLDSGERDACRLVQQVPLTAVRSADNGNCFRDHSGALGTPGGGGPAAFSCSAARGPRSGSVLVFPEAGRYCPVTNSGTMTGSPPVVATRLATQGCPSAASATIAASIRAGALPTPLRSRRRRGLPARGRSVNFVLLNVLDALVYCPDGTLVREPGRGARSQGRRQP